MTNTNLEELNVTEFEEYVAGCSDNVQRVLEYLRETARNAGVEVFERRQKPKSGCGITYYQHAEWFCQLHPKREDHVQVLIKGAQANELKAAGFEPSEDRQDGQLWFRVSTMGQAVRAVSIILVAHDGVEA